MRILLLVVGFQRGWGGIVIRSLRTLRRQRQLTLREVSEATGVSLSHLSQIERGQVAASLSTLSALAAFYDVPVSFLFEDASDVVTLTKRGEQLVLRASDERTRMELLSPDLNRKIEFLRITMPPGSGTHDEMATHPGEEVHFVLEGEVEFTVGGKVLVAEAGDSCYFLSTVPHRIRNVGKTTAVVFMAMTPPTQRARELIAARQPAEQTEEGDRATV